MTVLFRNLCISVTASATVGLFFALSCMKTFNREEKYYLDKLSPLWFHEDGTTSFIYAANWEDNITKVYFFVVNAVLSVAIGLSFGILIISIRSVNVQSGHVSETTRKLKQQFTRTLIGQVRTLSF